MLTKNIKVVIGGKEAPGSKKIVTPSAFETSLALSRTDRAFQAMVTKKLKPLKLNAMQWLLLGVVEDADETGISLGAAAKTLDVSLPQMTALSSKLVDARLLRIRTQRSDRRSRRVMLSARGRSTLENANGAVSDGLAVWFKPVPDNYLAFYRRVNNMLAKAKTESKTPKSVRNQGSNQ